MTGAHPTAALGGRCQHPPWVDALTDSWQASQGVTPPVHTGSREGFSRITFKKFNQGEGGIIMIPPSKDRETVCQYPNQGLIQGV